MRNLLRQPLTWMVIAECIVVTLLIVVVWNVVASAAVHHSGGTSVQAADAPADASPSPLPDLTAAEEPASPAQLPGLNLDARFWQVRLNQLNQDQVFFEQLEWHVVRSAMDAAQAYLETVVLPSITRAERA
ncbi:MAG TPA: hypothetical protein VN965_00970 [Candidatus Dormibacteraeota bacterium]|jgi:hypothetical protein|nr:hypothetical protein [Candidatus Dormibacteraeota bacterium]